MEIDLVESFSLLRSFGNRWNTMVINDYSNRLDSVMNRLKKRCNYDLDIKFRFAGIPTKNDNKKI